MPDRKLLEKLPLYRKHRWTVPDTLDKIDKPAVKMFCPVCGSDQTFNMSNEFFEECPYNNFPSNGAVCRLIYRCSSCDEFERYFLVRFADDGTYVTKVGQYPPWDTSLNAQLEEMLGDHSDMYKKGLICESQGYGIGAFAYYRRIIEQIICALLDEIAELLTDQELVAYETALAKARATIVTQEKIALVKDLLPPILRPGGTNPLSLLHEILSAGLHDREEEDCLESAMAIRETLLFLVNQVRVSKRSAKEFTESVKKLLDRKSRREEKRG